MPFASASNNVGKRCGRSPAQPPAAPEWREIELGREQPRDERFDCAPVPGAGRSGVEGERCSLLPASQERRPAGEDDHPRPGAAFIDAIDQVARRAAQHARRQCEVLDRRWPQSDAHVSREPRRNQCRIRRCQRSNKVDPRACPEAFDGRRRVCARTFKFSREVAVMAIVNRTPDSFFDRGATFELDKAVNAAIAAANDGAGFVDIGGVPFGRGPAVSLTEEIDRVVPLVATIHAASDVAISVDTCVAKVARLRLHRRNAGSGARRTPGGFPGRRRHLHHEGSEDRENARCAGSGCRHAHDRSRPGV
jgi:hypothetical protein